MLPNTPTTRRLMRWLTLGVALVAVPIVISLVIGAAGIVITLILIAIGLCLVMAVGHAIASAIFGVDRVNRALDRIGIKFETETQRTARGGSPLAYPSRKPRAGEVEDAVVIEEIPPEK